MWTTMKRHIVVWAYIFFILLILKCELLWMISYRCGVKYSLKCQLTVAGYGDFELGC